MVVTNKNKTKDVSVSEMIERAKSNKVDISESENAKTDEKWKSLSPEQKIQIIANIYRNGIGAAFKKTDFVKSAFDKIKDWLAGKFSPKNWLMLRGQVGLGKSKIAQAICTAYNRVNYSPYVFENTKKWRIYTAQQCVAAMKVENETNEFKKLCTCHKLMIDDIGSEFTSDRYYQVVFGNHRNCIQEILFERYERNLPTIITSNLNTQQLETIYGSRILDRLKEKSVLIGFEGKSFRN